VYVPESRALMRLCFSTFVRRMQRREPTGLTRSCSRASAPFTVWYVDVWLVRVPKYVRSEVEKCLGQHAEIDMDVDVGVGVDKPAIHTRDTGHARQRTQEWRTSTLWRERVMACTRTGCVGGVSGGRGRDVDGASEGDVFLGRGRHEREPCHTTTVHTVPWNARSSSAAVVSTCVSSGGGARDHVHVWVGTGAGDEITTWRKCKLKLWSSATSGRPECCRTTTTHVRLLSNIVPLLAPPPKSAHQCVDARVAVATAACRMWNALV
jgi:hypothetical protein